MQSALALTATTGAGYGEQYRDLRGKLPTDGDYPTRNMEQVSTTVIHHTATQGATLYSMAEFQVNRRGWAGIGYHYAVGWDGTIYHLNDVERRTNHTEGNNSRTIGIALVGNLDVNQMPPAQRASTINLIYFIRERYGTEYIRPHRFYKSTACPGRYTMREFSHLWDI